MSGGSVWFRRTCRLGAHPFNTSYEWATSCYDCEILNPKFVVKGHRTAAPLDILTATDCQGFPDPCWPRPVNLFDGALVNLQLEAFGWDPVVLCCPQAAIRVLDLLVYYQTTVTL